MNNVRMDKLLAMQTFVQVVEAKGFTAAAGILNVPKASVSQRVSALETHLGLRLLQRSTRKVSLTEDGRSYYAQCLRLLAEIEAVEQSLQPTHGHSGPGIRGLLRVESLPSIARCVLAPQLPSFTEQFPQMQLHLSCTDRIVDLLEEGVDCAIRGGALPDSNLVSRKLCTVYMGLYASPAYLARMPAIQSAEDLSAHVGMGEIPSGLGPVARMKSAQVTFSDGEMAVAASMAGLGIVRAPPFAVQEGVLGGLLRPVLPELSTGEAPLSLVYPSQRHLSPRVKAFVAWALRVVQAHPTLSATPLQAAQAWAARG
jgi:LysR family transcriptional regulator for bpeEF and oprC